MNDMIVDQPRLRKAMFKSKLENTQRFFRLYLKSLALDFGLLKGHRHYTRFIILGTARTGSNFLRSLLNSNSRILAFGELFRFYDSIGWDLPDYDRFFQSRTLVSLMQEDPARFLEKRVFRKYPANISAVGFKIFYYHAQNDTRKDVWNFLRNREDIKVIHLKRNNTLRLILSLRIAHETDRWTDIDGTEEKNHVISISYEDCLRAFTEKPKKEKQFDIAFQNHDKIDVLYEDLSYDYEKEMKRIQDFLGIQYEPLKPSTFKQAVLSLSKAISNYFELKDRFRETPWIKFFED